MFIILLFIESYLLLRIVIMFYVYFYILFDFLKKVLFLFYLVSENMFFRIVVCLNIIISCWLRFVRFCVSKDNIDFCYW